MNYQIVMKCYDCKRSVSNFRCIPSKYINAIIGCKICNNKIRVKVPQQVFSSYTENNAHMFVTCFKCG